MPGGLPRIVFVHGSVMGGRPTWSGQRPLADRFELDILERPGFPPNPPVDHVDFDDDAVLVAGRLLGGAHLVGHSYGGVIALLAAAAVPERVRSLTVIEPPATRVARGNAAADDVHPCGSRVVAGRPEGRSGGVPAGLPRVRRLRLRPALSRYRRSSSRARAR